MSAFFKVVRKVKTDNTAKLRAAVKALKGTSVSVGIHQDAGSYPVTEDDPDPEPVWKVAMDNEYGSATQPARPFLYPTVAKKESQIKALVAKCLAVVCEKQETPYVGMGRVGFAVQVWIQNTIKSNVAPGLGFTPGSKAYLARRMVEYPEQGSRTLIASGLLLRSVRFVVWDGDKAVVEGPYIGDVRTPQPVTREKLKVAGQALARELARKSAAQFKKDQKDARGRAKAFPEQHAAAMAAQRANSGLPPLEGGK